jgi:ubiquinone/menaquinone biosynthesis C-methylase UbiE
VNLTPDYTSIFCETYDEMESLKDPSRYGSVSDLSFYQERVKEHPAFHRGLDLLELGAGTGRVAFPLAKLVGKVTALDASSDMVAHMRTESRRRGVENMDIVEGRFEDFRFDRMFDVILLPFNNAHYLENAQAFRSFLANAWTHLKPGGCVYIDAEFSLDPSGLDGFEHREWREVELGTGATRLYLFTSCRNEGSTRLDLATKILEYSSTSPHVKTFETRSSHFTHDLTESLVATRSLEGSAVRCFGGDYLTRFEPRSPLQRCVIECTKRGPQV